MNKRTLLLTIQILFGFCTYAQDQITALYFKTPPPSHIKPSLNFPKDVQGCYYKDNDSLIQICIKSDSIYSSFSLVFTIPNSDMIDKKYEVKDSLIYGIKKNTGIPFKVINDTSYAFLKQTDLFFKISDKNILKIYQEKYYISEMKFDKFYSVLELSKQDKKFSIKEYDPEKEKFPTEFLNLEKSTIKNVEIHLANPSENNWINFLKNKGFNEETLYHQ
jgi:hypothetical protein